MLKCYVLIAENFRLNGKNHASLGYTKEVTSPGNKSKSYKCLGLCIISFWGLENIFMSKMISSYLKIFRRIKQVHDSQATQAVAISNSRSLKENTQKLLGFLMCFCLKEYKYLEVDKKILRFSIKKKEQERIIKLQIC